MNLPTKPSGKFARWGRRALAAPLILTVALSIYVVATIYRANFHVVVNGEAYRSGQMNAGELTHTIQKYGIKSVLNLRGENLATKWHQTEIATAAK